MTDNHKFKQKQHTSITKELVWEAVQHIKGADITTKAPLGFSSDIFILFENDKLKDSYGRSSEISLRNHSEKLQLLITDVEGYFIFYGGWYLHFDTALITDEVFRTIEVFKEKVFGTITVKNSEA